jgi:hydroxymethylbilane synthase
LLSVRPDLLIHNLRGNLDTRLRKLDEGQFDAVILACAGVKRLGLGNRITEIIPFDISLPAVGQGAIGIECRMHDEAVNSFVAALNHADTAICVRAERAFLKRLEGGCQVPIAAYARIESSNSKFEIRNSNFRIVLEVLVGSVSGDRIIRGRIDGSPGEAENLGTAVAEDVLSRGAREILDEVYRRL